MQPLEPSKLIVLPGKLPALDYSAFGTVPDWFPKNVRRAASRLLKLMPSSTVENLPRVIHIQPTPPGMQTPIPYCALQWTAERADIFIAADVNRPSQFSYQMSHELGHVCCNYLDPAKNRWQWLEESLVEASAYNNMSDLDPAYARDLARAYGTQVTAPLSSWYLSTSAVLEKTRKIGDANKAIVLTMANQLGTYSPASLRYLNRWPSAGADPDLTAHLANWQAACAPGHDNLVIALRRAFECV